MKFERIKELIELVARSRISEFEITENGVTVRIGRVGINSDSETATKPVPATATDALDPVGRSDVLIKHDEYEIVAPLFGVVRLTPSPGALPFVTVGGRVVEGQTICLIEAMKVFTPVQADKSGAIVAVLVEADQEVDVGQPLLRLTSRSDRVR